MYKISDECRVRQAKEHEAWYKKKAKDKKKVRFFPFGTDWAEAVEEMTPEERKFYKVHIEKSHRIKRLLADILATK